MKTFLLIAPVFVTLATTMPASAQVYPDAGLNRLDDPNYGWPQNPLATRVRRQRPRRLPSDPRACCYARWTRNRKFARNLRLETRNRRLVGLHCKPARFGFTSDSGFSGWPLKCPLARSGHCCP